MNANQKIIMYQDIERHGKNLINLFNLKPETNPIKLCKSLHRLETKGNRIAIDYCNGNIESKYFKTQKEKILISIDKILNFKNQSIPVFLNSDPRGYALKIDDEFTKAYRDKGGRIETDLGGYGLISPEFDGK